MTGLLFDGPLVPGLATADDFLAASEEADLAERITALDLSPFRFQQWRGKRLTQSFGWAYDHGDGGFGQADPMPDWLLPVRARAAAFAGVAPGNLVQALLIRYDPGAGIGWHRDRPHYDKVVGISLGAPAPLRLRQRSASGFRRARVELAQRSIYLLDGEARRDWEHSIAPIDALRLSITFRSLSAKGRGLAI